MNIVIVGAGAVGLLFYQALYRCKKELNVNLSLQQHKTTIPSFTFTHFNGDNDIIPVVSTTDEHIASADIILICVKSYQVTSVLKNSFPQLNKHAVIILCHNGIGAFERYIEESYIDEITNKNDTQAVTYVIPQSVLALLITHGSKKNSHQHITHTGKGGGDLGLIYGKNNVAFFKRITALLNTVLPCITWNGNIKEKQWLKLAINSIINPLTAVNNIPNGDILLPQYQEHIRLLIIEFISVAKMHNITFSEEILLSTILEVASKTAKNRSSMLSDITNKQMTEIDYINGYIVKLSQQYNIAVPYHQALVQQVKALQQ